MGIWPRVDNCGSKVSPRDVQHFRGSVALLMYMNPRYCRVMLAHKANPRSVCDYWDCWKITWRIGENQALDGTIY